METIEAEQIRELCKSKDFDLLRINLQFDIDNLKPLVEAIMHDHALMLKDGYRTYEAIGMQYADPDNPLYDAVQQTGFADGKTQKQHRPPARYKEQNEIGKTFNVVYETLASHGILLERGRLLKAEAGHRHSKHLDYDIRIHLPILTNPDCQMVYGENSYHMMADGYIYLINGFRLHHFYNAGQTDRVHLVWLIQREWY